MAAQLKDVDRGYGALVQRVFGMAAKRARVDVGILDGDRPHSGGGGEDSVDHAVSILQVAIWNEFGTATIPERSFIRAWFDENEGKLRQELAVLMRSVLEGKRTREQILELVGQRAVAQIQARIAAGIAPENAPSTVEKKGSSTPLINTGALRSAVSYRVEHG
jgi:hypothetical protein